MCYIARISFSKKLRTAKKDIKVFKYAFLNSFKLSQFNYVLG